MGPLFFDFLFEISNFGAQAEIQLLEVVGLDEEEVVFLLYHF